ncbi:MAG: DUF6477 family protein [Paracoccaceae bacterium]|nr:DUF6477 family protein [Paracoccaceae bacterium]
MTDLLDHLDHLRRPRLLIRAARIGAEDYRRETHLPRLLGHGDLPRSILALARLIESEAVLDDCRRAGDAGYSVIRHLDVMIAMIGEARIIRAAHPALVRPRAAPAPVLVVVV